LDILGELQVILPVLFCVVLGIIAIIGVRSIGEWSRNNKQPLLSVASRVVSKRSLVHYRHHHDDGISHHQSDTYYYATFELTDGSRIEFKLSGGEYGLIAEQDAGMLTYQGTRFYGFERERDRGLRLVTRS